MPRPTPLRPLGAALLTVVAASPAAAEFRVLGTQDLDGWRLTSQQDMASPGGARWCTAVPITPAGALAVVLKHTGTGPTGAGVRAYLGVQNSAWQIGATSAGSVVVTVGGTARTVPLTRNDPSSMVSAPFDGEDARWLNGMLTSTTTVQLPNAAPVTFPAPSRAVAAQIGLCILGLVLPARDAKPPPAPAGTPAR